MCHCKAVLKFDITSSLWPKSMMALIQESRVQPWRFSHGQQDFLRSQLLPWTSKSFLKRPVNLFLTIRRSACLWRDQKFYMTHEDSCTQRAHCLQTRAHYNRLVLLPCFPITQQEQHYLKSRCIDTHLRSHLGYRMKDNRHMVLLKLIFLLSTLMAAGDATYFVNMLHCHWFVRRTVFMTCNVVSVSSSNFK